MRKPLVGCRQNAPQDNFVKFMADETILQDYSIFVGLHGAHEYVQMGTKQFKWLRIF